MSELQEGLERAIAALQGVHPSHELIGEYRQFMDRQRHMTATDYRQLLDAVVAAIGDSSSKLDDLTEETPRKRGKKEA